MARKKLLVMESQLNRERFLETAEAWRNELRRTQRRLSGFAALGAVAPQLASLLPRIGRPVSRDSTAGGKSGLAGLLNSAATGASWWFTLRSLWRWNER